MGYFGLASDVLNSIYGPKNRIESIDDIADATITKLAKRFRRPGPWWFVAGVFFALVGLEISMAFLVSYQSPTVGFSCRSGAYLVYGFLASVAWVISCPRKSPRDWGRATCYVINVLAVLVLFTIIFAQVVPNHLFSE